MLLRVSLPVFAEPKGRASAAMEWRATSDGQGKVELVGVNHGRRRARALELAVSVAGAGALSVKANVNPYILPGATRRWRIEGDVSRVAPGAVVHLTGASDEGRIVASPTVSKS